MFADLEKRLRASLQAHAVGSFIDPFAPTAWTASALTEPLSASARSKRSLEDVASPPATARSRTMETDAGTGAAPFIVNAEDSLPGSSSQAHDDDPSSLEAQSQPAQSCLTAEVLATLAALHNHLHDLRLSEEARASRCAPGLKLMFSFSEPAAMREVCEALDLSNISDEAVLCACQASAQPDVSGRAAAAFIALAVRPRLTQLEEAASRTLFSALLLLLQHHARVG